MTSAVRRRITARTANVRGRRIRSRSATNGWSANERKSAKKKVTKRTLPAQRRPTTAAVARTTSARDRNTPPAPGPAPVENVPVEKSPLDPESTAASVYRRRGGQDQLRNQGKVTVTTARRLRVASAESASPLTSVVMREPSMPCRFMR
jgi:hypothetical protein